MDRGSDGDVLWLAAAERFHRGLNHELSNRTAAIAAVVAVLDDADQEMIGRLREEVERLDALLRLKRLIPRVVSASAEPVIPGELVTDVLTLMRAVSEYRDATVRCPPMQDVPPLRCRPQALQHALLLLLLAVGDAGGALSIDVCNDDAAVTFGIGTAAGESLDVPGSSDNVALAAAHLLADDGALVWNADAGYRLRLPSLLAIRARLRAQAPPAARATPA